MNLMVASSPQRPHNNYLYRRRALFQPCDWKRLVVTPRRLSTRDDTYQALHCEIARNKCNDFTRDWSPSIVRELRGRQPHPIESVYFERRVGDGAAFPREAMPGSTHLARNASRPLCGALGSSAPLPFYTHEVVSLRMPCSSSSMGVGSASSASAAAALTACPGMPCMEVWKPMGLAARFRGSKFRRR